MGLKTGKKASSTSAKDTKLNKEAMSLCGICSQELSEADTGFLSYGCAACPAWIHAKCIFAGAKQEELQTIFKFHRGFEVKCNVCRQAQNKETVPCSQISNEICNQLTEVLPTLVAEVIKSCQNSFSTNVVKDTLDVSFAKIIQEQKTAINNIKEDSTFNMEKIANKVSNLEQKLDISPLIGTAVDKTEEEDRNRRKKNVIVFNLPESNKESISDQVIDDCEKLLLLLDGKVQLTENKIVQIFRIGNKDMQKKRPMVVKCNSENTKWEILRASKNLKYLDQNHESFPIQISLDRTLRERQERKELYKELNNRLSSGEKDIMIKGNRIIKKTEAQSFFRQTAQQFSNLWASALSKM